MKLSPAARACALFLLFSMLLAGLSCLFLFFFFRGGNDRGTLPADSGAESETVREAESPFPVVVLDAGHGAPDGGCVGADGSEEKDLNLSVAEKLCAMLRAMNIPCVMTRTEDALLYDRFGDLDDYTGKKKVYDLKNRLRIAESYENAIFVSIHMNAFPDPRYSGLQVYYSGNVPESAELAAEIQALTREHLQPGNERKSKRAGSSIYLLDKTTHPAVLVECGFLSNPAECAALSTDKYRGELATVLFCALVRFINSYMGRA